MASSTTSAFQVDGPSLRTGSGGVRRAGRLKILAPTRYPWLFNGPRCSRHAIHHRNFLPLNYLDYRLDGVTGFLAWPGSYDLIHAFNRIPVGRTPFVIGFESHLPRAFGLEDTAYMRRLTAALASPRCRGIVAISEHAADIFRTQHAGSRHEKTLLGKLSLRYPNVELPPEEGPQRRGGGTLGLVFVGAHFGRKGGCVVVRMAEMAMKARLPVVFHVVSSLQVGGTIWTDPVDGAFFDRYRALLDLPNVRWSRSLPNAQVKRLLSQADLHLLPTLGDTFGFSAIEALACGTPVLGTAQGALPEFIQPGHNGFLLRFETNAKREWVHLGAPDRASRRFAGVFADEVERLAAEGFEILQSVVAQPDTLTAMRKHARGTASRLFDATRHAEAWDDFYDDALMSPLHDWKTADA